MTLCNAFVLYLLFYRVSCDPQELTPLPPPRYGNACGMQLYSCAVYVGVEPLKGGLSGELGFLPLGPFVADLPPRSEPLRLRARAAAQAAATAE